MEGGLLEKNEWKYRGDLRSVARTGSGDPSTTESGDPRTTGRSNNIAPGIRTVTNQPLVLSAEEDWRRYDRMEARLTAPLSERMLDLAGIETGMRVLDLATGRGM